MLDDPLNMHTVIAVADAAVFAGATSAGFVCTGRGPTSSTYRIDMSSSHWIEVFVGHQYGKRNRYTIRFTESELVADPIDSTKNSVKTSTAYAVVDRSLLGAGSSENIMLTALATSLLKTSDGSGAMFRILTGET